MAAKAKGPRKEAIPCVVICNTKWGYTMAPHRSPSIRAGVRYAKSLGLAYRIYDLKGFLRRSGW